MAKQGLTVAANAAMAAISGWATHLALKAQEEGQNISSLSNINDLNEMAPPIVAIVCGTSTFVATLGTMSSIVGNNAMGKAMFYTSAAGMMATKGMMNFNLGEHVSNQLNASHQNNHPTTEVQPNDQSGYKPLHETDKRISFAASPVTAEPA